METLSLPDKKYFAEQFDRIDTDRFLTPILFTMPDGGVDIFCHVFYRDTLTTEQAELEVLPNNYFETLPESETTEEEIAVETPTVTIPQTAPQKELDQGTLVLQFNGTLSLDQIIAYSKQLFILGYMLVFMIMMILAMGFLYDCYQAVHQLLSNI